MNSRGKTILAAASRRSSDLLEGLPKSKSEVYRANFRNIIVICQQLLAARPPRRPTADTVAEEGGYRFEGFPKRQTLFNHYGHLIGIWREAYIELRDIGSIRSKQDVEQAQFTPLELEKLDEGTRQRVQLLSVLLKEQVNLVRSLKATEVLKRHDEEGRTPDPSSKLLDEDIRSELRTLFVHMKQGVAVLEEHEVGVKISSRARPGSVVFSCRLAEALRNLAG